METVLNFQLDPNTSPGHPVASVLLEVVSILEVLVTESASQATCRPTFVLIWPTVISRGYKFMSLDDRGVFSPPIGPPAQP